MGGVLPAVTALCPTYGRFSRLAQAVRCFLRQDYPARRLIILNDALVPVRLGAACGVPVAVVNTRPRFATLGHKRQALLQMAETPLVAHWDDDDICLPWHLSQCVERLLAHPSAACAKPQSAWLGVGPPGRWRLRGVRRNVYEAQMVFRRSRALELGGYGMLDSGQAKVLLEAFRRCGELHTWGPRLCDVSYVYRWGDENAHVSAGGGGRFAAHNRDFGAGRALLAPAAGRP